MKLFKRLKKTEPVDAKRSELHQHERSATETPLASSASPVVPKGSGAQLFLIQKPWITEKSTRLSRENKYVFLVNGSCNTSEARKALASIYGVHVVRAHSVHVAGKKRRLGATQGRISGYKKIIVTLKEGESIDVLPH